MSKRSGARAMGLLAGLMVVAAGGLGSGLGAGAVLAEGRCGKYKMDGAGNCLTPAFYRCTKAWAACNNACKSKPKREKCSAACDDKYAPQCGD